MPRCRRGQSEAPTIVKTSDSHQLQIGQDEIRNEYRVGSCVSRPERECLLELFGWPRRHLHAATSDNKAFLLGREMFVFSERLLRFC